MHREMDKHYSSKDGQVDTDGGEVFYVPPYVCKEMFARCELRLCGASVVICI